MNMTLRDEIKQTRPFSSLEQEAYLSMGRTWAVLEHQLADALKAHDITPTQYNVLRIVRGAGKSGLCRSDITERMITPVPDVTRLLDRMEAAGHVRRERSSEDRRFVTTRISEEGLRVLGAAEDAVMKLHTQQFAALGAEDLQRLVRILEVVRGSEALGV